MNMRFLADDDDNDDDNSNDNNNNRKNNKSETSLRVVTRFENDVSEEYAVSIFRVKEIWFMLTMKQSRRRSGPITWA
jgi:hypothetical protein